MRVLDVLRDRGIELSDDAFAALLDEALTTAGPPIATDPARVLTPAEAAALAEGGASLDPLSAGTAGPDRDAEEAPPLAEAAAAYGAMLASSLTVAEAAARLGIDPSRVRHRLGDRSLYGIRLRRGWRLPAFQFGASATLPGSEVVLAALASDLHPVAILRWLSTPLPELVVDGSPVSPLTWLAGGGDPAPAAAVAASL